MSQVNEFFIWAYEPYLFVIILVSVTYDFFLDCMIFFCGFMNSAFGMKKRFIFGLIMVGLILYEVVS